jgi:hypothetical protein
MIPLCLDEGVGTTGRRSGSARASASAGARSTTRPAPSACRTGRPTTRPLTSTLSSTRTCASPGPKRLRLRRVGHAVQLRGQPSPHPRRACPASLATPRLTATSDKRDGPVERQNLAALLPSCGQHDLVAASLERLKSSSMVLVGEQVDVADPEPGQRQAPQIRAPGRDRAVGHVRPPGSAARYARRSAGRRPGRTSRRQCHGPAGTWRRPRHRSTAECTYTGCVYRLL